MFRYRIQFSKLGPAGYLSHLDLVRTFERAMRRAGLPLAFSQGFNPHPRFNFAAPLPVGVCGEREYLDLELEEELPPDELARRLAACLPEGLSVAQARPVPPQSPALMAVVQRAVYRVCLTLREEAADEQLAEYLRCLLNLPAVTVIRRSREGVEKSRDIRPGIFSLAGRVQGRRAELEMELQIGGGGNVRPEEVIAALVEQCGLPASPAAAAVTRTGLFPVT